MKTLIRESILALIVAASVYWGMSLIPNRTDELIRETQATRKEVIQMQKNQLQIGKMLADRVKQAELPWVEASK